MSDNQGYFGIVPIKNEGGKVVPGFPTIEALINSEWSTSNSDYNHIKLLSLAGEVERFVTYSARRERAYRNTIKYLTFMVYAWFIAFTVGASVWVFAS